MQQFMCRFEPWGVEARVDKFTTVLEAARQCGVPLEASCGGKRACGTCAVEVVSGALEEPRDEERVLVSGRSFRLGCRARIVGDVVVRPLVGAASLPQQSHHGVVTTGQQVGLSALRGVVALDIGTTTLKIAASFAGDEPLFASAPNSQVSWGADVISRLAAAQKSADTAKQLQRVLQHDCVLLVRTILSAAGKKYDSPLIIERCVIAANTVMAALFCGADLTAFAAPPYGSAQSPELISGELFDELRAQKSNVALEILPPLGQLVGGDITAGLFLQGAFSSQQETLLYIDLGTNVETALVTPDRIFVGSAPAGSAFVFEGVQGSIVLGELAYLLDIGALSRDGLLNEAHDQVHRNEEGVLVAQTPLGALTQLEVRAFQLAKSAISVSVSEVLRASTLNTSQIDRLVFAGVFGEHVAPFIAPLGLVDADIMGHARVEFDPNAALKGALLYAQSGEALAFKNKTLVPLNFVQDTGFNERLMAHLDLG